MNSDTLENLLIDRALGQLSPDVEALLAEHLAGTPGAAEAAAELKEVVALATASLCRTKPKLDLPPRIIALPRWPRAQRVLAMAASFVAGAGIAFFAMRETTAPYKTSLVTETPPAAGDAPALRHSPETERALRKLPFWSKERAVLIAGAASGTNP